VSNFGLTICGAFLCSSGSAISTPHLARHYHRPDGLFRPPLGGVYSELSAYLLAFMSNGGATTTTNKYKKYDTIQNRQIAR